MTNTPWWRRSRPLGESVDGTVAAFAPDKYIPLIHAWMADQGTVQTRMAFADNPPINTDGRNHE